MKIGLGPSYECGGDGILSSFSRPDCGSLRKNLLEKSSGQERAAGARGGRAESGLKENWDNQDRHDIDDLDHRIDGRASGVFVGIAHSVASDCGGMGE